MPPTNCPIVNQAPLRLTQIPAPIAKRTARDAADYIDQLIATIRQCNADKEGI